MSDIAPTPDDLAVDLTAFLELADKATPGPWYANVGSSETGTDSAGYTSSVEWMCLSPQEEDTADSFAWGDGFYDSISDQNEATFNFMAASRSSAPAAARRALAAEKRVAELEAAIRKHRDQKADDRCIEDDDHLYEALGDGIKCDRRVGDKQEMLHNCARFIERRCEGGGWPSYAELEADNARLQEVVRSLADRVAAQSELLSKRAEENA